MKSIALCLIFILLFGCKQKQPNGSIVVKFSGENIFLVREPSMIEEKFDLDSAERAFRNGRVDVEFRLHSDVPLSKVLNSIDLLSEVGVGTIKVMDNIGSDFVIIDLPLSDNYERHWQYGLAGKINFSHDLLEEGYNGDYNAWYVVFRLDADGEAGDGKLMADLRRRLERLAKNHQKIALVINVDDDNVNALRLMTILRIAKQTRSSVAIVRGHNQNSRP
jgi:hypothetical protein